MRSIEAIADEYARKGWLPFPLPPGRKWAPPKGVPGNIGHYTSYDWDKWGNKSNIGTVMPENTVGIDFDGYKDGNSLPKDLPPTYWSSSREGGSGIYFYRIPPGSRLQGTIPGVGETVQWFHRYAVVWPSMHPEGRQYDWADPGDRICNIPNIDDLPELPWKWFRKLEQKTERNYDNGYDGKLQDWLDGLRYGPVTGDARHVLQTFRREMRDGSRYDAMVKATARLVGLGASKHRGVAGALEAVQDEYICAVDGERERHPSAEFARALAGAIAKFGGRR
jgi:hypothetical protein